MSISRTYHVWYLLTILLTLLVKASKITTIEPHGNGLVHSCIGLNPSKIEICSLIEVNDDIMSNDGNCRIEECRETCCSGVSKCFKTNFLTANRIDCVANRLNHKYAKVIYTAGAFGIVVATTGLYLLTGSKKKEEEVFDSSYDDEDDPLINIKDKNPHLDVKKIMATDEKDVFWDEKENL
ncbi:hypothetical protein MACJ_001179 [Theileria orientalis]|uniref:Uncharacterized protein n=1 Tax=Theileria orientalis TaxID=68886 RepID=A0A976M810_THEOR|nr:hypothetical protein MACJ_001179 [Theileria orientalis]